MSTHETPTGQPSPCAQRGWAARAGSGEAWAYPAPPAAPRAVWWAPRSPFLLGVVLLGTALLAAPEGVYMARWFGLGLLGIGLTTLLARDAANSAGGYAVGRALAVTYGIGVVLALWGTLFGPFNTLGWIAVGLNLLLGSGFAYAQLTKPRATSAPPS